MAARRLAVLAALLVLLIAFVLAPTQGQTTTDTPTTSAPATDAPTTSAPATDAPTTSVPATDAPATDTPATDAPATDTPTPTTAAPTPTTTSPDTTTPTPTTSSPTNSTTTPTPTPTSSNSTSTPTPTPTTSACGPRVRRAWRDLSASDKLLYRDAIKAAMTSKYHTLFQEILTDKDTCNEAYLTGATIFWHRRYLLAYENMLRSLEPRFACITIPYWDMFTDFATQVTNVTNPVTNTTGPACTSMEQCSNFLGEFGGSSGAATKVSINGYNITTTNPDGNCVNGLLSHGLNPSESSNNYADFSNFCENSANGTTCSGCIPRGTWNSSVLPSTLAYSMLVRVLRPSYGFYYFANAMQYYFQSPMHNSLNATMATCATAADPMFYSLQATFDLVHQLYYDCQIGANLTDAQKQSSSSTYVYQQYTLASGITAPTITANMTMYWNSTISNQRVRAEDHSDLKQFFAPLPSQYWYYASINDLGNNSYSYLPTTMFSTLVASLSCPKNHVRRLIAQQEVGSVHAAGISTTPSPSPMLTPEATPTPTLGSSDGDSSNEMVAVPDGVVLATANLSDSKVTKAVAKAFNCYQTMVANISEVMDSDIDAIEAAVTADCVAYHKLFKKVDEFSLFFLKNMGLSLKLTTVCSQRVKEYENGSRTVPVDFMFIRDEFIGMNDTQLANLSSITTGAAVVPVTAFHARTIADVAKSNINFIVDGAVSNTSAV